MQTPSRVTARGWRHGVLNKIITLAIHFKNVAFSSKFKQKLALFWLKSETGNVWFFVRKAICEITVRILCVRPRRASCDDKMIKSRYFSMMVNGTYPISLLFSISYEVCSRNFLGLRQSVLVYVRFTLNYMYYVSSSYCY